MAASSSSGAASGSAPSAPTSAADNGAGDEDVLKAPSSRDTTPATTIPIRDKESFDKYLLETVITKDKIATAALSDQQRRTQDEFNRRNAEVKEYKLLNTEYRHFFPPSRIYGEGYKGYGNGTTETNGPPRIVYPKDKPRPGKRLTPSLPKPSRKDMREQAEQHEELVPVRLDVDWDKVKLRDTFTWNLHERLIPIDLFSAQLVEDMGLKNPLGQPVYEQVKQQIQDQLTDYYPAVFSEEDALDPELPYSAYKNDEMRILVKLNITIGLHTLVDQFEWEINNPMNSPEEFAQSMARDLSLSGEFTTSIAHCIREQTQLFTKSLYSIGHPFDGRPIEDADLVNAFLPSPIPTVFRPHQQAKEYAPFLYELSEADLEKNELIFSREQRRQKRSVNRRGGPQLPDLKERQRTVRTLVVSATLPGAAATLEESRLFKRAAGAGTGRGKRGVGGHDGANSDSEDSDDSAPDSPAISQLAGTARTRGMRGAATVAQQKMANLGRSSETPEAITLHHHETRISSRRFPHQNRDSEEPGRLIVTLRVSKDKLRRLMQDLNTKRPPPSGSQTPMGLGQPSFSAPPRNMGPPLTPSGSYQNLPKTGSATPVAQQPQLGRLPAPPPPISGQLHPQVSHHH